MLEEIAVVLFAGAVVLAIVGFTIIGICKWVQRKVDPQGVFEAERRWKRG